MPKTNFNLVSKKQNLIKEQRNVKKYTKRTNSRKIYFNTSNSILHTYWSIHSRFYSINHIRLNRCIRWLHSKNFGKLIDPLADKATQIAVLASLTFKGIVPLWILLIVFIKEIVMVAGASFLYGKKLVVSSRWYGKLATVLFYVAIVCSLFIEYWNTSINSAAPLFGFDDYIYYLAIATTIFSLVMYFRQFYQQGYLKKENLKIEE